MSYRQKSRVETVVWTIAAVLIVTVAFAVVAHALNWFGPRSINFLSEPLILTEADEEISFIELRELLTEFLEEIFEDVEISVDDDIFVDMTVYCSNLGLLQNLRSFMMRLEPEEDDAFFVLHNTFYSGVILGFIMSLDGDVVGVADIICGSPDALNSLKVTINQITIYRGGAR